MLEPLRDELRAAVARVLDSERYILGPEVQAFEREFAAYCGAAHAVGVANGTDAITIALRAMGVGPGDEVLVPSFTFYASVEAIAPTGATPVFCDIDPQTFCINAETVAEALTPHTKAVIAVHLFGNLAPVAEIEALGVPVLEDAAQAAGSTVTHDHRTHGHAMPSGPVSGQSAHCQPTDAHPTAFTLPTATPSPTPAPGRSVGRPPSRSSPPRTSAASATGA